jgi:hypothetical protein
MTNISHWSALYSAFQCSSTLWTSQMSMTLMKTESDVLYVSSGKRWNKRSSVHNVKCRYYCQFLKKIKLFDRFSKKYPHVKFHENPSIDSRVVPCGRTNGQTCRSSQSLFANLRKQLELRFQLTENTLPLSDIWRSDNNATDNSSPPEGCGLPNGRFTAIAFNFTINQSAKTGQ